ncbi:endonuclease/exonuclease/phosphatase family protein [Streptomyces sp. V4-01]|uniref:Endonuclease/exonuclease/phosphatase family protein n=1 Tax=Actinacidiphila polyblastidii TaxID=3110430 RepID=A0ABU7P797_9ACTN|nr:endonuclease/exonuclease/phosphatase family protein [Streptomyces sp. V4-01]
MQRPEAAAVDTARSGPGGAGRPASGPGRWRARTRRAIRAASRPGPWKRGPVLAALALLLGLLMLLHASVPNRVGHLGSLVETFLPWFGVFVPVLLAGALWRRSAAAVVALLLPAVVWLNLFGGLVGDRSHRGGGDLTVAEHNVGAGNPDPPGTARDLTAAGADLLALVELTPQAAGGYEKALATAYPYHTVLGTVGLWSRLPLSGTRPVDVVDAGPLARTLPAGARTASNRALRTTVATAHGPLAVYVAHLGSARVTPRAGFWTASRDRGEQVLGAAVAAERNPRVVLLGDLNGTTDDRALRDLTSRLHSAQREAGAGFGFTWPAAFPVARIDQILVRGVRPVSSWVLPATGSDHLPVAAGISW